MKTVLVGLMIAALVQSAAASEKSITIISFGRSDQAALSKAFFRPFSEQTGIGIESLSYDGQTTELKEMARTGKANWDVVQVESRTLQLGCESGLFEKLRFDKIGVPQEEFIPGAVSECGVGIFTWGVALAFNGDKLETPPRTWADFWDLQRFPGKRGLRRSAKYTLEIALLADGVRPQEVYALLSTKAGVDRAFRKLDRIKDHVIWWTAAADPQLYLGDRRLIMTPAYTLWLAREQSNHPNLRIAWDESLYDVDSWAIPRNTSKLDEAYRFIAFASKAENQKTLSQEVAYGPTNRNAVSLLADNVARSLPSGENLKRSLKIDTTFWISHGEALEKRFDDWAPLLCAQQTDEDEDAVDYKGRSVCQDNRGNMRSIPDDVLPNAPSHHAIPHSH
jgi:putative spermidine/putrescine transport system substrate-binding protein